MSEIIELTDENFETRLKSADKPVLVDYWAESVSYTHLRAHET